MEIKDQVSHDVAKLAAVKDFEARLVGLLEKIRKESLDKLKYHDEKLKRLIAIVHHHESRNDAADIVLRDVCLELQMVMMERYDDNSGHAVPGGNVDNSGDSGDKA